MHDSVQHQKVLALYEQENTGNNEQPSYSRLKTSVRRHIDQTSRTRNFRAQNKIVARGAVNKSRKGRKVSAMRKVGECYQWKAIGQCSKGDSCSFSHAPASGNRRDQRQEGQSSSPAPKAKAPSNKKIPSKSSGRRGREPFWNKRKDSVQKFPLGESVRIRDVIFGTLPCVSITSLDQDAHIATNADSDTLRLMGSPARSRRKVV